MTLRWKTAVILILNTTILIFILFSFSDLLFKKHLTEHEHLSEKDVSFEAQRFIRKTGLSLTIHCINDQTVELRGCLRKVLETVHS